MKPEELRREKITLESDLMRLIQHRLDQFHEATGFSPEHIDIEMTGQTRIGETVTHYLVTAVVAEVRL